MKITIKHTQAVWETATLFDVEVPDPLPDEYESVEEWAEYNIYEILSKANMDEVHISVGDIVHGIDSEVEVIQ